MPERIACDSHECSQRQIHFQQTLGKKFVSNRYVNKTYINIIATCVVLSAVTQLHLTHSPNRGVGALLSAFELVYKGVPVFAAYIHTLLVSIYHSTQQLWFTVTQLLKGTRVVSKTH